MHVQCRIATSKLLSIDKDGYLISETQICSVDMHGLTD